MGRRYYCDYCDKAFIDDVEARKKHLNSSTHQKIRKEHYLSCRDAKTTLAEEVVKSPCHRFQATGECPYFGNCRYTHYTQEQLWKLKMEIEAAEGSKAGAATSGGGVIGTEEEEEDAGAVVDAWLARCLQRGSPAAGPHWRYPPQLGQLPDLPPSLRRLQPHHFKDSDFATWGE